MDTRTSTLAPPPSNASLSPPLSSSSSTFSRRSKVFPGLSSHGMPKSPPPLSSGGSLRPHRFSGVSGPVSPSLRSQAPSSPMSPPPMSPPMSAKSFSTFIDSEPSTPAYSPRQGSTWEGSTLVLLSPPQQSSAFPSPTEPVWQMVAPPVKKHRRFSSRPKKLLSLNKEISSGTSLSSHPITPFIPEQHRQEKISEEEDKENKDKENKEEKEEQSSGSASLEKLASKVRSILQRKSSDKPKEKKSKKEFGELDRVETLHWTEM